MGEDERGEEEADGTSVHESLPVEKVFVLSRLPTVVAASTRWGC